MDRTAKRRERRESRRAKREEADLRRKIAEIRAPRSEKLAVISTDTFQRLRDNEGSESPQRKKKNKHWKASQTEFALTDFLVKRPEARVKRDRRRTSGTTVKLLKRGKVREIPKAKSLSKLKRAIVAIRERRKLQVETPTIQEEEQDEDSPPITEVSAPIITHSRKFRPYCDHANNPDIRTHAEKLLQDLFRFQDRAYDKNQIKARAHRRYVVGFKEVQRNLEVNRVKLLIVATDLEPSPGDGGLDETVESLKGVCQEKSVQYCFPLLRRKIGYLLFKKAPISCVGVLDYDGAEEHVKALMQIVARSRRTTLEKDLKDLTIN